MAIFNKENIQIISLQLKMISFILIAPITLIQCFFKFISTLLKWTTKKIDNLFKHKRNEDKSTYLLKETGNFFLGFIPRVLGFTCNFINAILSLPKIFVMNLARIFENANNNSLVEDSLFKEILYIPYYPRRRYDGFDEIDDLDKKFHNFMFEKIEKFDRKINR